MDHNSSHPRPLPGIMLKMAFILCVWNSLLGHPLIDFDETLGRVDNFYFRFRPSSETVFENVALHQFRVNSLHLQSRFTGVQVRRSTRKK